MYPAVLPKDGLPDGFAKLISPSKSLLIPSSEAENVRSEALSEWLTALSK
jgi:thiamine transport system substrate-binding protein